jgi:hypothetical protein
MQTGILMKKQRTYYSQKTQWADNMGEDMAGEVAVWLRKVENELAASAAEKTTKGKQQLGIRKKNEKVLPKSLKGNMYVQFGEVTRVGFSFARHGIYWYKGASRNHKAANPRTRVDWFNKIIEQHTPELETIVHKYYADAVINVFNVYIDKANEVGH